MEVLTKRIQAVNPSPTFALNTKAQEMMAQGIDVISFGVGEPDFNTPEHIKEAGLAAIENDFTRYTPAAGIPELRQAIADKFREENGLEYEPSQILVTVGGKHALFNSIVALVEDGDEVVLPAPYWVSYPEQIKFAGGEAVVPLATEETGFKLTGDMLREAVTPRTKLLMLNTPNNPTGAVYSQSELEDIAEVCIENDICVISDEVYEKLLYDGNEHVSLAALDPEMKKRTVVINGVSKAYAMTGWRIGYAAGDSELIGAMNKLQGHMTSNPTSIAQKAALAAVTGSDEPTREMLEAFDERRKYMVKRLNEMPGVSSPMPGGAFYVFPNISDWFGKTIGKYEVNSATDFAEAVLELAEVAIVPGEGFGAPDNVRLSYSASMEVIETGLNRIEEVLESAL